MLDADPGAMMFPDAVRMNDHQGSTWTEIVGVENVRDMRIGAMTGGGGGTEVVKAASFAGMALTFITVAQPPAVDEEIADGAAV